MDNTIGSDAPKASFSSSGLGVPVSIAWTLPRELINALWDQGVCMDDWDYVVFAPPSILLEREDPDLKTDHTGKVTRIYTPNEWTFERILTGPCDNTWYKATIDGQSYAVGVAYHA